MTCPFCEPGQERVFYEDPFICCLWDAFPVNEGHALVVPKRHVATWFDASRGEHASLLEGIEAARAEIERRYSPDGFNIGMNVGEAAGQTVPHLHVHVIPRYRGDVADPRGGVRYVIPDKANYLVVQDASTAPVRESSVFGSAEAPLLPALLTALSTAQQLDLAVAFVTEAGFNHLEPHLIDLLEPEARKGKLRFLTGDYLDVTEPRALRRLLDLSEEYEGRVEVRVFQASKALGFHPKAYLIHHEAGTGTAFVGSSNLTRHALTSGVEWNQQLSGPFHEAPLRTVLEQFERLLSHPSTHALSAAWIDSYERRRDKAPPPTDTGVDSAQEPQREVPDPHPIQQEALAALVRTREEGNEAGLVVMATGLGKTWLAAFDSEPFSKVLFVAHREEILNQAVRTFRRIRPDADLGMYASGVHEKDADVLFASVQTLSRTQHLQQFSPTRFDYIVVDEFHHASAGTYRRLIDHFQPKFLLGLTATPERSDGGDLLALCGENLVFRCDLADGIHQDLLSPFHYFGIPDEVEFENIPWRNGRFDPTALENAVATEARAQNAFEQWRLRAQARTLAFCVSRRHAEFMCSFFQDRGVRAVAVHSGPESAPRAQSLEALESGDLQVVFAVDMFNEGVDIPAVDTVLMLRPTESKILWLQQFGRGLRKAEEKGKTRLTVIDYIGNHRTFLQVPMLLLPGAGSAPGTVSMALQRLERGELELPPGCAIQYELEALNILKALAQPPARGDQLAAWYRSFRELHNRRPLASEAFHEGYDPRAVKGSYGSWLSFVQAERDLTDDESAALKQNAAFLEALETTAMTKSFKMVTLLAMLAEGRFPGSIGLSELASGVRRLARRNRLLREEFGDDLDNDDRLQSLLKRNPIAAWVGGRGTGATSYFEETNERFSTVGIESPDRGAIQNLVRELADWRLGQYLDRLQGSLRYAAAIHCELVANDNQWTLELPNRTDVPGIPKGWFPVSFFDAELELLFEERTATAIRTSSGGALTLDEALGQDSSASSSDTGTPQTILLTLKDGIYHLEFAADETPAPELWAAYLRADIPPLWELNFSPARWNQGFVLQGNHIFLLVSLNKDGMEAQHQYADRFLRADLFQWMSQNQTRQDTPTGRRIKDHAKLGIDVHLFVRDQRKTPNGKAAPFIYCGEVNFVDWEGDKPIKIRWQLRSPVPARLHERFEVPG